MKPIRTKFILRNYLYVHIYLHYFQILNHVIKIILFFNINVPLIAVPAKSYLKYF